MSLALSWSRNILAAIIFAILIDFLIVYFLLYFFDDPGVNQSWGTVLFGVGILIMADIFLMIRRTIKAVIFYYIRKTKAIDISTQEMRRFKLPRDVAAIDWETYKMAIAARDDVPLEARLAIAKYDGIITGLQITGLSASMAFQATMDNAIVRYLA